mgnify:FL=1
MSIKRVQSDFTTIFKNSRTIPRKFLSFTVTYTKKIARSLSLYFVNLASTDNSSFSNAFKNIIQNHMATITSQSTPDSTIVRELIEKFAPEILETLPTGQQIDPNQLAETYLNQDRQLLEFMQIHKKYQDEIENRLIQQDERLAALHQQQQTIDERISIVEQLLLYEQQQIGESKKENSFDNKKRFNWSNFTQLCGMTVFLYTLKAVLNQLSLKKNKD